MELKEMKNMLNIEVCMVFRKRWIELKPKQL